MDAFAVSVCKGLSVRTLKAKHAVICGLYFGGFQLLMPLIGFALGVRFQSLITSIDHWIAFVLLGLIGANMVRESREHDDESVSDSFRFMTMLPLAVATSIDALAVGVTFAFLQVDIVPAVSFIGAITFVLSCIGVKRRAVRRYRTDFDGSQNPAGAFGFSGIKLILPFHSKKRARPGRAIFFAAPAAFRQSRNRQDRRTAVRRIQFSIKVRACT